jgi:hypothetical protein
MNASGQPALSPDERKQPPSGVLVNVDHTPSNSWSPRTIALLHINVTRLTRGGCSDQVRDLINLINLISNDQSQATAGSSLQESLLDYARSAWPGAVGESIPGLYKQNHSTVHLYDIWQEAF